MPKAWLLILSPNYIPVQGNKPAPQIPISFPTNSLQGGLWGHPLPQIRGRIPQISPSPSPPGPDRPWQSLGRFPFPGIHRLRRSRSRCRSGEGKTGKDGKDSQGKALGTLPEGLETGIFRHKHVEKQLLARPEVTRKVCVCGAFVLLSQHDFPGSLTPNGNFSPPISPASHIPSRPEGKDANSSPRGSAGTRSNTSEVLLLLPVPTFFPRAHPRAPGGRCHPSFPLSR